MYIVEIWMHYRREIESYVDYSLYFATKEAAENCIQEFNKEREKPHYWDCSFIEEAALKEDINESK